MRFFIFAFGISLALAGGIDSAAAQSRNLLETTDQARQRHSAERYQEYERRGFQEPLGGYRDRLGDPAPPGTERPGYTSPQPYGSGNSAPAWGGNRTQNQPWGTR